MTGLAKLPRLLRREPDLSEAEAELLHERTMARLESLRHGRSGADDPEQDAASDEAARAWVAIEVVGDEDFIPLDGPRAAEGSGPAAEASGPAADAIALGPSTDVADVAGDAPGLPGDLVSVMVGPDERVPGEQLQLPDPAQATISEPRRRAVAVIVADEWDRSDAPDPDVQDLQEPGLSSPPDAPTLLASAASASTGKHAVPRPGGARSTAATRRHVTRAGEAANATVAVAGAANAAVPVAAANATALRTTSAAHKASSASAPKAAPAAPTPPPAPAAPTPPPAPSATVPARAHPTRRATPASGSRGSRGSKARAAAPPASCPYCALLLEPPPTASRRCTRCRQRIVVRKVDGRAVFLTEAALAVFESERRRGVTSVRLVRERARWLSLATGAGAPAARAERLERMAVTDEVRDAARALYLAAADRAYREAKRERRWEDASAIRRAQAAALYRAAGSPMPPSDAVLALLREASIAGLRGVGELTRDAALVGTDCCEVCRADEGLVVRISAELKAGRLPHTGCERGLCRCGWGLADKDKSAVARYLRRQARG